MNVKLILALITLGFAHSSQAYNNGYGFQSQEDLWVFEEQNQYQGGPYQQGGNYQQQYEQPQYSQQQGPWDGVVQACQKRESDPYRATGQVGPLQINLICSEVVQLQARVEAKGVQASIIHSQPQAGQNTWSVTVSCEELRQNQFDIARLCQLHQEDYNK